MKKEIRNNMEKKSEKLESAKNNLTEIVFILDRSGSMSGLESDTIGGFNSMIDKQKKEDGECYVTTVLFDSVVETLHDRVKLSEISKMTDKEYFVRGSTALLDAIGTTIKHISNIHKYAREEDVPANTIFVITTDGMENSSREYSSDKVKKMIEKKKGQGLGVHLSRCEHRCGRDGEIFWYREGKCGELSLRCQGHGDQLRMCRKSRQQRAGQGQDGLCLARRDRRGFRFPLTGKRCGGGCLSRGERFF
jgi:hypothetical protein